MKRQLKFRYYGRYVDDMIIVSSNQKHLLAAVKKISDYLSDNLSLTLHPKKVYMQHASKGVSFLGVYIKPYRVLVGKRVKQNVMREVNQALKQRSRIGENNHARAIDEFYLEFCQKINSYLGLLRQSDTYNFRRRLQNVVDHKFGGVFKVDKDVHTIAPSGKLAKPAGY